MHKARRKGAQKAATAVAKEAANNSAGFAPPGSSNHRDFGRDFDRHFYVPKRTRHANTELVSAVNDFHYAMMNDIDRNEFYYKMLEKAIVPGVTTVLEIGPGSGLLSMMAASLGAKWVVACEGSAELSCLARRNIEANKLKDKITVHHMMSTQLRPQHLPNKESADVLVSELFGTLLLGESALDYIADIRSRPGILSANARILPRFGVQYAVPIECEALSTVSSAKPYRNFDLSHVNALCDTSSCVFSKKYGFRMNSVPYTELAEPQEVVSVDFTKDDPGFLPRVSRKEIKATKSGKVHGVLMYWKAWDDVTGVSISTNPRDTTDNFARDMQWGQAIQLIDGVEENVEEPLPTVLEVKEGETLKMVTRASDDSVVLQFAFSHATTAATPTPADK